MKRALIPAVALLVLASSLFVWGMNSNPQQGGSQYKYIVAKLPPSNIDLTFNSSDRVSNVNKRRISPLDSLGRDGWKLVSVVVDKDGNYICFFTQPK